MSLPLPPALPRLYAILDAGLLSRHGFQLGPFARDLYNAGVRCMQYRDKSATSAQLLQRLRALRAALGADALLIANDRADICVLSGCDGLHVGQNDVSPGGARRVIGRHHRLGISTHNQAQLAAAHASEADYIAIGPVFETASKQNPDPVIGLAGIRRARTLTSKPLVAIGGITHASARSVIEAGADSIAVISALIPDDRNASVRKLAEDFLALLL